jgi:hypothetical protein
LTANNLEVYNTSTSSWRQLQYSPSSSPLPPDLTISANTTLGGTQYVNNLTINAGVTVTVTNQALVFICTGDVVINGTITANGKGPSAGVGTASTGPITTAYNYGFGFGQPYNTYSPTVSIVGTGGSSSGVTVSAGGVGYSSNGGNGGGGIVVRSYKTITIGAAAVLNAGGGNATLPPTPGSGSWSAPGSSGGSGGSVILRSDGNMTVTGTIIATGGNGGAGTVSGLVGATGGSGAGGGFVILQCGGILVNTASINVAGGSVGANAGAIGTYTSIEAPGNGGLGGNGAGAGNPNPGSAGVIAFAGSPI